MKTNPVEFLIAQSGIMVSQIRCLPASRYVYIYLYRKIEVSVNVCVCIYMCVCVCVCMKMLHTPKHLLSKMEGYQEYHTGGAVTMAEEEEHYCGQYGRKRGMNKIFVFLHPSFHVCLHHFIWSILSWQNKSKVHLLRGNKIKP